jgi:hypothetical protein
MPAGRRLRWFELRPTNSSVCVFKCARLISLCGRTGVCACVRQCVFVECVGRLNGWYIIYHCSIIVVVVFSSLCVSLGKEII